MYHTRSFLLHLCLSLVIPDLPACSWRRCLRRAGHATGRGVRRCNGASVHTAHHLTQTISGTCARRVHMNCLRRQTCCRHNEFRVSKLDADRFYAMRQFVMNITSALTCGRLVWLFAPIFARLASWLNPRCLRWR